MTEQEFEALLRQALCPEIDPKDTAVHRRRPEREKTMGIRRILKNTAIAAAVLAVLTVTAYAADFMNIQSLVNGRKYEHYSSVTEADRAMKSAGFRADIAEAFDNGYTLSTIDVQDTEARDENDRTVLTYNEIVMTYQNDGGRRLILFARPELAELPQTEDTFSDTRTIGGVMVNYKLDHYKFVPEDYEPTEEDRLWMAQPGNYLSYGADEVFCKDVAFLLWTRENVRYSLMDNGAKETQDNLFAMARQLIEG